MPYKPQFRPFAPPPLRTPSFLPEPVYMDSEIPEEEPGLQGPPPALQSPIPQINAPIPDRPKTNVEQFDELNATRPKPIGGIRRVADAFVHHGVPGMASELLNPSAKREQYAQDVEGLLNRQKIQHQQTADDTNVAYKQSLQQDMRDRAEDRKLQREDADLNRDRTIANEGWEEVTGNRPPQMGNPGEPSMYEYGKVGGKTYRRLSAYAQTKAKKAAEQDSFEAIPDNVADVIGIPRGTKVPPAKLDAYFRIYETHQKNQAESPEAQVASRTKTADLTGLKGRDRQVYIATGRIERPANVSVAVGSNISDQALDMAADVYARTGQLPAVGMGRDAAAVRTKIMNRAAEQNPDADLALNRAEYGANKGSLAQLQKQKGQMIAFENTASKNLDIALEVSNKVDRTGSPLLNKYILWTKGQISGDTDTTKLHNAVTTAANEYAKVISGASGGVVTDAARKEAEGMLNAAMAKGTFTEVVAQMKREMENRRSGFDQQLDEVRGGLAGGRQSGGKPPALSAPGGADPLGIRGGK